MNKGIGVLLMNIAVALYLFATGIVGLSGNNNKGFFRADSNEIRAAVNAIFKGDFANVLVIIISVLAIAAGIFIILKLFNVGIPNMELILIILAIVWLIFIVLIDIVAPLNARNKPGFIAWLLVFAPHLMVLSGIILSTDRFGGR